MRLRMAFCVALATPICGAWAQTPPSVPDSATTYRHQVGLTASPVLEGLFKNNRSLPLGVLYKRQLTPARALRLGAVANYRYQKRYDPVPLSNRDFRQTDTGLQAYAGLEWQRPLSRRCVAYAGVDVGAAYTSWLLREYSENGELFNGAYSIIGMDQQARQRTYSGFVRPLTGIRFHLRRFLYLSAETTLLAQYSYSTWKSEFSRRVKDTEQILSTGSGHFKDRDIRVEIRPVSQLSVHYLFGRI
ncbi:hypothetical protein HNQ93_000744 [Hymenobacter luteus]|uniref:DUF481 domain-containing protein n=2 Tax=Hymenobacter TaxID=89966 RepID=A0A7W9SZ85_9BACT|nr:MULTISPECIES: hypothetical protein [Hymenobacter]MBB4599776.1 hypothetical protein [Hymenobacter latericoloratus]MBB6057914.1 hypothetical protein [Hymenobacter luteus]